MIFVTESGSAYQIDEEKRLIRQIKGRSTTRLHRKGIAEWAAFEEVFVEAGKPAFIMWPKSTVPLLAGSDPDLAAPATITSRVVRVTPCLN